MPTSLVEIGTRGERNVTAEEDEIMTMMPDISQVMALEEYPQKTLRECSKMNESDPGFVDDEHLAVNFDDYITMVCTKLKKQVDDAAAQKSHEWQPVLQKPSTMDALILSNDELNDRDTSSSDSANQGRIILIEIKNRGLFKRGRGGEGISDPLELTSAIELDLVKKLYDSALMLLMLNRITVLTARRTLIAYIVCASEKNEEYAGRVRNETKSAGLVVEGNNGIAGEPGLAAIASIMHDDKVSNGLFDATVFTYRPKMAKHFEQYLYSTVRFITEEQLPVLMSTIHNVHP